MDIGGDTDSASATLLSTARMMLADDHEVAYASVLSELFTRNYEAGIDRLSSESDHAFEMQLWFVPTALLQAQLYGLLGQRQAELSHYSSAAKLLESRIHAAPDDARFHGALGIAYAARIRTQMTAGHSLEQLDRAIEGFIAVGRELGVIR